MLQNDIPDTNRDEKLQRLYFELEQAREDQRVSLDHIVQALVACIAALAILYSVASGFGSSGQNDIPFKNEGIAFIAACIILVAGFYCSSIGIERMFRYHYMEEIERNITLLTHSGLGDFPPGWNVLSSRLITSNVRHLTNQGARRHYVHFACALVFLVIGCLLLSGMLLLTVNNKWVFLFLPIVVFSALSYLLYGFFVGTDYSRELYTSIRRLHDRGASKGVGEGDGTVPLAQQPKKYFAQFRGKFARLVYTRPRDAMKTFFYLGGAALGTALFEPGYSVGEWVFRFFLLWLVVDLCGYQARYLINDIRGIDQDGSNPRSEGRNRLPLLGNSKTRTIRIGCLVVFAKALVAGLVCCTIASNSGGTGDPYLALILMVFYALVFLVASLYEVARGKGEVGWNELLTECFGDNIPAKASEVIGGIACDSARVRALRKMSLPTMVLVTLGYPLRFLSGLLAFDPDAIGLLRTVEFLRLFNVRYIPFIAQGYLPLAASLALSCMLFGCTFVYITWSLEASDTVRSNTVRQHEGKSVQFTKPHIAYLGVILGTHVEDEHPLRSRMSFFSPWNWTFVVSIVLLDLISLCLAPTQHAAINVTMTSICYAIAFIWPDKTMDLMVKVSACLFVFDLIYMFFGICFDPAYGIFFECGFNGLALGNLLHFCLGNLPYAYSINAALVIQIIAVAYLLIYLIFRKMNYEEMNAPFVAEAVMLLRAVLGKIVCMVFGQKAVEAFCLGDDAGEN